MLIDRTVEIGPCAGDLHVRLVDEPPVAGSMAARPRSLDELRSETLHPPVDGDMIHGDATFSEQFLDVAVRQAVPQVPADRDRDHLPREPEACEDRGCAACSHQTSLRSSAIGQCNSAYCRAVAGGSKLHL
jgi:hypothetical protein